jgi:protein CpxP
MTIRPMLITAALLLPLAAAGAQPPAPDAAGMAQDRQDMRQDMAQRQQETAQDLAIVLRLTPAQQPALSAWMQAMTPAPHDWHGGREQGAATTTPEQLAVEQQRMAAHDAEAATRLSATRQFYAQLDPQQQRVFDALDRLRHDRSHGMHGRGMRGRGGPDGGAG